MNRCAYPWQQMVIDLTGEVVPCCYWSGYANTGAPLGNTNLQTIDEIWNGEAYRDLRARLVSEDLPTDHPCANCMAARAANGVYPPFSPAPPFSREEGHCFIGAIPEDFWADAKGRAGEIELLEDGVPLPLGSALHADIRSEGRGRYSAMNGWLWFSSSDNTDPASNGRTYLLRCGALEATLASFDSESQSGRNLRKAYEEYLAGEVTLDVAPTMISFISTADCNIDCPGCSQNLVRYAKVQHRAETVDDVLAHVPGLAQFIWHGGEPFLIKRFRDFIDNFERQDNPNLTFGFTSNGTMITEAEAKKLEKFPRLNASVSIDSFTPDVFAKIRAGAQFDRVVENLLRLSAKHNGADWIMSVGMIVCKSNMAEIDKNVGFAVEHDIGLNLSPVVVYPVREQLNVFEDFEQDTRGWREALARAKAIAADAKGRGARAMSKVDFGGMLDEIERIIDAATHDFSAARMVQLTFNDPTDTLSRTPNAAVIAYVENTPIAYRMLNGSREASTIHLPLARIASGAKIRFDLAHSVYEPFGVIAEGFFEARNIVDGLARAVEVYVPEYRGTPRGRNINWANYGATTQDGAHVARPSDVFDAYRARYADDVADVTKGYIKLSLRASVAAALRAAVGRKELASDK